MIICISGLSGSGKNSVGALVAQRLGLRLVNPTFKTIAAKQNMSLMDFHRKAEKEHSIDKEFDAHLISETSKGNCVVTTWLGPWMVKNADIKVWLCAPREVRAHRVANRDGMTTEQALQHITSRDESNHARYHGIYKINIYDHSGFELVINSARFMPGESADIIVAAAKALYEGEKQAAKPAAPSGFMKAAPKAPEARAPMKFAPLAKPLAPVKKQVIMRKRAPPAKKAGKAKKAKKSKR